MVGPTDEPKYYRWYFSQLPGSKPPFANAEFHAAIRYQATRYLFHQINVDAEAEMDRLRNTNLATEASLKTTGFMRLLASLSPWYHDPTAELGELIEEINNGIQSMYTRLRRLEVLYDFFKIDAEWKSGFFTLTRPRYRGGPLVDKDWRDAGKLTLADYYRRSALAVEDFYRKKYVGSIEELEAKLAKAVEGLMQIERIYYQEATNPSPETIRRMSTRMNGIAYAALTEINEDGDTCNS